MSDGQIATARRFRELHENQGMFLMPDAWNPKSARMLEAAGFPAIGTTRSGIALSLGVVERQGCVTRRQTIDAIAGISRGIDVPLSIDFEAGFDSAAEDVAEMIRRAIDAGAVGGTVADQSGTAGEPLFDTREAVERIAAAREAANSTQIEFTITARTNVFVMGIEAPFAAAVRRANLFREAGADCVFVPGVNDLTTIGALAREIDAPLGIAVGGRSFGFDLADLNSAGVKRVSLGGYLARASMAHIRRAAKEMLEDGTFDLAVDHLGNGMLSLPFYSAARIASPSMWR